MQKQVVNEVVANNSNYTPAPIVRITAEQYSALANHIFDHSLDTYGRPLAISWEDDNATAEFEGYSEGRHITTLDISMMTFDAQGDSVPNDFNSALFEEYLAELTTLCYEAKMTDC